MTRKPRKCGIVEPKKKTNGSVCIKRCETAAGKSLVSPQLSFDWWLGPELGWSRERWESGEGDCRD